MAFDELRQRLIDGQGELHRLSAELLSALDAAEEENRRLRDAAETVNLVVYTEPEAAEVLRMSQDTLARLRAELDLPHFRAGMLVRYTNSHLAEITEILSKPARGGKRVRAA
jgi:hypothetical protein